MTVSSGRAHDARRGSVDRQSLVEVVIPGQRSDHVAAATSHSLIGVPVKEWGIDR